MQIKRGFRCEMTIESTKKSGRARQPDLSNAGGSKQEATNRWRFVYALLVKIGYVIDRSVHGPFCSI